MSNAEPERILFVDYDGDFKAAQTLSSVGFVVDQIRPDALRQVGIGDHDVFVFSFGEEKNLKSALDTCEKLKSADLKTPIVLICEGSGGPEFLNHQKSENPAEAYISKTNSMSAILDALDRLVGVPIPPSLRSVIHSPDEEEHIQRYLNKIRELKQTINDLQSTADNKDKALEAQRNYFKPKLKAILEGQKIQIQTETETLKYELSEMEARLIDRNSKLKELEKKAGALEEKHKAAQQTQRDFYQQKIKKLEEEKAALEAKIN